MSLLNTIMAGMTPNTRGYSGRTFTCPSAGELGLAVAECFQTVYETQNTINTADVIVSTSYAMEGTDPTAAMEGAFSGAIEKIKAAFVKLKEKIKKIVDQAIRFFQSLFTSGADFVKKYGDAIKKKPVKGFKFKGYVYTQDAGTKAVKAAESKLDGEFSAVMGKDLAAAADANKAEALINGASDAEYTDSYKSDILGSLPTKPNEISDLKADIAKAFHDGESSTKEGIEFTDAMKAEYLAFVPKGKDLIGNLKTAKSDFETKCDQVIKRLDSVADGDAGYKVAHAASQKLNVLLAIKSALLDAQIQNNRDCLKGMTALLKRFYIWSGKAMESDDLEDEGEPDIAAEAMMPFTEADVDEELGDPAEEGDDCSKCEGCKGDDDDDTDESEECTESFYGQVEKLLGYR